MTNASLMFTLKLHHLPSAAAAVYREASSTQDRITVR